MKEITITLQEYKELLEIKGKYEELKEHQKIEYIYVYQTKPYDFTPKVTWATYEEQRNQF